jgi:hypothetical protein
MSGIKDYSTTPANNTALFPEGMAPSAVNDGMRQVQADIRSWYNDAQWAIYGDGDGAFAIAYVAPGSFSVAGVDVTAVYHTGRRVKATGALTGTIYGTIQSSAFATNTTVAVLWDGGGALQNEVLTIAIGILSAANFAMPSAGTGSTGAVQLATQVETEGGTLTTKAVTPGGLAPAVMTWTGAHVFQSSDSGPGEVVAIDLDRASATPAANDLLMALRWKMRDGGGGTDVAAKLVAKLLDPIAGSEDAELQFATVVASTLAARLILGNGLYTPNAAGGDKGADTINVSGCYTNGILMPSSDMIVSGITATPNLADHGKMYMPAGGGFSLTLPTLSSLFSGYRIGLQNQITSGTCVANRSGSDTIASQGTTGLTSITLPSLGDQVWLIADVTNARWVVSGLRSFESTEIAIATSAVDSKAHGLGVLPKEHQLFARCKTAELGFTAGDEIAIGGLGADRAGGGKQYELTMDATSGVLTTGSTAAGFAPLNKTTPAGFVNITNGNWRYFWRAWVRN